MGTVTNIAGRFFDTLTNALSGLGTTAKDKKISDLFGLSLLGREQLEAAYRGDWIARKVTDIIPRDMTREWRCWQASKTQIEKLEEEERRLNIRAKVARVKTLARLYGGAALVLGNGDSAPENELKPDSMVAGGLKFVHVMHRYEITPEQIERDPMSPYFGEPKGYQIATTQGSPVLIHPSRVIRFIGAELPDNSRLEQQGWGDSTLQALYDSVRNAASVQENFASLISEAKLDIIRMPDLMSQIASTEYEGRLIKRFQAAMLGKSNLNALVMDKEEEWDQRQLSLAGMPDVIRAYLEIAAGAADIPIVRLLGISPGGLNATGQADLRNYYDNVSSQQKTELSPNLVRLDELLIRSALGRRPASVHYGWNSLWQETAAEKADNGLKKAQATNLYGRLGVMARQALATAVQNMLIEDGFYPGLDDTLKEAGATVPSEPISNSPPADPEKKPKTPTEA